MRQLDANEYHPEAIALIQCFVSGDYWTAARILETFDDPGINSLPFAMAVAKLAARMLKNSFGGDESMALNLTDRWLDAAVHLKAENLDAARQEAQERAS